MKKQIEIVELKGIITEIKISLEGFKGISELAQESVDLKTMEIIKAEEQTE